MKSRKRSCALMLAVALAGTAAIRPAKATSHFWIAFTANWSTAGDWSLTSGGAAGGGVPVAGDSAFFSFNDGSPRIISYDPTVAVSLATVSISQTGGGSLVLSQTSSLANFSADQVNIAPSGTGSYQFSAGNGTINALNVANFGTGVGTFSMPGGNLTVSTESVGGSGTGTVTQFGSGTQNVNVLTLAGAGGTANYTLSSFGGALNASQLTLSSNGTALFTQSGGTLNVNSFNLGNSDGLSTPTFVSTGGTMTVAPAGGGFLVGNGGSGLFKLAGGSLTVGGTQTQDLTLGVNGGNGTFLQTSGFVLVKGSEQVGFTPASTALLTVSGGSQQITGSLNLAGSKDTANISSQIFVDTVNNNGNFNLTSANIAPNAAGSVTFNNTANLTAVGGSISGSLVNGATGNATISSGTFSVTGGSNLGSLNVGAGANFAVNGSFRNDAAVTMQGSTITMNGALTNNSSLAGFGSINVTSGSASFVNNSSFSVQNGNFVLGINATNNGEIDVAAARQLTINVGLTNSGLININNSTINGSVGVTNTAAGIISGNGTITAILNNSGLVYNDAGVLNITSNFVNAGTLQVDGPTASIIGGNITNNSLIQGHGSSGSPIVNNAEIDALGGTLFLNGVLTNFGTLAVSTGNKLVTHGLSANTGIISLTGGTFDNANNTLTNNNQISGYGTFKTGGLTNNGSMTFTGGVTTVNGDINNSAGRLINIKFTPAIFTGNITNHGTFKTTSTTVTFTGTYTEAGTFFSDPATQSFGDVNIDATGAWIGGNGDVFVVNGNFISHSTAGTSWDTQGAELRLQGGGTHIVSLNGADVGETPAGFNNNFSWGTLTLENGNAIAFEDDNANTGAALYIHDLNLPGGLSQLSSLSGSAGLSLYYDPSNPANAYLNGQSYVLSGGAMLAAVPEPASVMLLSCACGMFFSRRRRQLKA